MLALAAFAAFALAADEPATGTLAAPITPSGAPAAAHEVDAALLALAPGLAGCRAGEESSPYHARIDVRADGTVSNVELSGAVNECVRERIAGARLEARSAPYSVSYKLTLAPTGATFSTPILLGALDKAQIDRVIKSHTAEVRHCYQRALTKDRGLAGKLVVKFVIAKDGTVSSATTKSSTLSSPTVEACVNERFMKFDFDEPRGGGIVIVSYPFIFTPDDGQGLHTAHATFDPPPAGTRAGTLEVAAIDAVVERGPTLEALRRCRAAASRDTPGLWGEIVVQLVIAETGQVSSAVTKSSTMKSPAVEACVNTVFEKLRFPAPEGNGVVVVSYPLVYASR